MGPRGTFKRNKANAAGGCKQQRDARNYPCMRCWLLEPSAAGARTITGAYKMLPGLHRPSKPWPPRLIEHSDSQSKVALLQRRSNPARKSQELLHCGDLPNVEAQVHLTFNQLNKVLNLIPAAFFVKAVHELVKKAAGVEPTGMPQRQDVKLNTRIGRMAETSRYLPARYG